MTGLPQKRTSPPCNLYYRVRPKSEVRIIESDGPKATYEIRLTAISGISKNLGLDSESVKMPIQVVRDVADFIVSPS
jgi:hypothetical protein